MKYAKGLIIKKVPRFVLDVENSSNMIVIKEGLSHSLGKKYSLKNTFLYYHTMWIFGSLCDTSV